MSILLQLKHKQKTSTIYYIILVVDISLYREGIEYLNKLVVSMIFIVISMIRRLTGMWHQ